MCARVAYLHSILHWGSTEWYLRELFKRLEPAEFEPCDRCPTTGARAAAGARRACACPTTSSACTRRDTRASPRASPAAPDLVHVADVDPSGLLAARLSGVRTLVVTYHTPELTGDNVAGRLLRRLGWRPGRTTSSRRDRDRERIGGARSP